MKKILIINASARGAESKSRALTEEFVNLWKSTHGEAAISFRDLSTSEVPFINEGWIQASSKKKQDRDEADNLALKHSDLFIEELKHADYIVLGSPMYNWSVPAVLKGYIDQIIRINETWRINPDDPQNPYVGLLENKTLLLLLSRGGTGYEKGEPNEHMNFQSPYLEQVFKLIGINDIHTVAINGESMQRENLAENMQAAHHSIKSIIEKQPV